MKHKEHFLVLALITISTVATLIAYPHLPEFVPIHWNWRGQINGYAHKWLLFMFPGIVGLFFLYPWLSPKHFKIESFKSTYLYIMVVIACLLTYIDGLVLWAGIGHSFNTGRSMLGGVCLAFALLGNVMGKVRQNFYLGVRTPWSLANERVWNATHRFAAKTYFVGGTLAFVLLLAGTKFWLPVAMVLVGGLAPMVYSFIFYKQLGRQGEL